jgi:uncharacterized phage protein (TIGR02218 family)
MKTLPSALADDFEEVSTTLAYFMRVARTDGEVFGFTSVDRVVTVDGLDYEPGFDLSALASGEGLNVDNLEVTILPDLEGGTVTRLDLLTGKWNNAEFQIFEANYLAPENGINPLKMGNTGEVKVNDCSYVLEFRDSLQIVQQPQGDVLSKNCRARLGDSKCRVDLTDFTVTGDLSAIASRQVFTDSARTEPEDWFGEGEITITSGANEGYRQKVKTFVGGVFTLSLPLPFDLEVGDEYTAIAGCRKRHDRSLDNPDGVSDCIDKFDNILNFQGEPHGGGLDKLTRGANGEQPESEPA